MTLANSNFIENVSLDGGSISLSGFHDIAIITNVTFEKNIAMKDGAW